MQDRAVSAASGLLVYLDFKAEKIWGAQVGKPRQLVIGQLFHGLAVQRTHALVLDSASRYHIYTLRPTKLVMQQLHLLLVISAILMLLF